MILKIYDSNSNVYPYDIDKTFFVTECYNGEIKLQWDMSPDHPIYSLINEETQVEFEGQMYLIKDINERKLVSTINCELDLTGLQRNVYTSYKKTTESFYNVCREILSDSGWSVIDAELVAPRRSLDLTDVSSLDILNQCTNATSYGVTYKFDSKNKKIYIVKPENNTTPTGAFFTDELNLTDLTFKGSTKSLVTRIYPYGKDGLDISSVNGGKKYIDCFDFTDKIVSVIWRDERYTNAQELYDDAQVKLDTLAKPERSYTCKVNDLAKQSDKYSALSFKLYDIVTLIDRKRHTRINHRIVEYKRYPADASLNTVTLSTVAGTVTGKITALDNKFTELSAQQLHDRTKVNEIKQDLDSTVLHVSESWASSVNESLFTQTSEGLYLEVDKVVGTNRWSTLLQQSATDIRIAWNNISKYIQFENAELNIYNSSSVKLMSLNSYGQNIYDYDGAKLMSLNSRGQEFFYKGNKVGKIGTGCYVDDADKRDLSFALENGSAFMDWSYKVKSTDTAYTMMLTYCAQKIGNYDADQLHTGCDLNLHNYYLRKAVLKDFAFEGGSISGTWSGNIVTSFYSDGRAATWKSFSLTFKNGILQSATW